MKKGSIRWLEREFGMSKTKIWKAKLIASIPKGLFDKLLDETETPPSIDQLVTIARVLRGDHIKENFLTCPSCGEPVALKNRTTIPEQHVDIVNDWLQSKSSVASET